MIRTSSQRSATLLYVQAPNRSVDVRGVALAYRELGSRGGVPIVLLNHWGAGLDNFDPRIVDGLASCHHVIAVNYRGVGASEGQAPETVEAMAQDILGFLDALGHSLVDLLGFSLGGFVAQEVLRQAPSRVRKVILTGTGPAGGQGIDRVGAVSWPLMLRGLLALRDPKYYLFFTSSAQGRIAATSYLRRLKERKAGRDKLVSPGVMLRQLKAIKAWGRAAPQDLGQFHHPALIVNGANDIMVPPALSEDMAIGLANAELVIYADAGHGSIFQNHEAFVLKALAFLRA